MKIGQVFRIIFSIVAGILIIFGMCSLIYSFYYFRELWQWDKTPSFDIRVDLSEPGEFSKQFTLNRRYADTHSLYLILPDSLLRESELKELLGGIEASISFLDHSGAEIEWLRELPFDTKTNPSEGAILLLDFGRLPINTYTFRLTVSHGAGALSGVEQRIFMKNNVGFAAMLPVLALWVGILSLIFGIILALLIRLTRKKLDTTKVNQPIAIPDETEQV